MIVIHHLNNSRSQRVLWLLEELGLPHEVKRYQRDPVTLLAPPELRRVHPLGKSPVIEDGALVLAETGAIVEYLSETYGAGSLAPPREARWQYLHWLHHAEGSAMPPLVMKLVFAQVPRRAPMLLRPLLRAVMGKVQAGFVEPRLRDLADYWEKALAPSGWFAGPDFSAADIMMSFPVEAASQRMAGGLRPALQDFLARIHSRPAYRRALERGGPYDYA